jgi:hypothetical protein
MNEDYTRKEDPTTLELENAYITLGGRVKK